MNIRRQVFAMLQSTSYPVYGLFVPSSVSPPYATYHVISDVPGHTHAGHDGTAETRIQVSCYATSYQGAGEIAESVFTSITASTITNGVRIPRKLNELDFYEEDTKVFHIPVDFQISHVTYST